MKLTDNQKRAIVNAECRNEWDNVNDPPCHPGDKGWDGCSVCGSRAARVVYMLEALDD